MKAVNNGTRIAGETAKSLSEIVDKAKKTVERIDKISLATKEQAESISQIMEGVSEISIVVQSNSTAAEHSDDTAKELTDEANPLRELLEMFNLSKNKNN